MPNLRQLYYYPIKGLQGIALPRVSVEAGERLPSDRRFAIGDQSTVFDDANPSHIKKQNLVVQMKHEKLAALGVTFDPGSATLSLSVKSDTQQFALETPQGRRDFERTLTDFMAAEIKGPARLISAPGLGFTDLSHKSVSLINLNSVRALEEQLGYPIDPRRFRANLYFDGVPAWEEESWLEKTLEISGVRLKVYRVTDRCTAINVNPQTAERDTTLQSMRKALGHINMGVYATIENAGELVSGSEFALP